MWELDYKESWVPKNSCFQIVVLEKTLDSPLDSKEIKPVNPKGKQPWIFIGRIDAKAETPILWPSDAKSQLTGKDTHAGKDWGLEEKGMTEDEMVGWHHWLDGRESEWTPGVGDGQGGLAWCNSWGCKELDMTEQPIWTEGIWNYLDCSHTVAVGLKSLKLNYTLLLTVSLVISLESQSWIRTNSKHKNTKVLQMLVFHNWKDIYSF